MLRHLMLLFAALSAVLLLKGSVFALGGDFVVVEEILLKDYPNRSLDVSADGQYIVYDTYDDNSPYKQDIFLIDRKAETSTRLSASIPVYKSVVAPFISDNGKFAVFTAFSSDYTENGNVYGYLFDVQTNQYINVMRGFGGQPLQIIGHQALITDISADGRYVVYVAATTNPFDGKNVTCIFGEKTRPCIAVFLHDRMTGKTERISVNSNEEIANSENLFATVSSDGRYVIFESISSNLDGGNIKCGEYYCFQLYMRDRQTGKTSLVTKNIEGKPAKRGMLSLEHLKISADNQYVAFVSNSEDLLPGVSPNVWNVYLQNIQTGERELISVSTQGTQTIASNSQQRAYYKGLTPDARYVLFSSTDHRAMTDDPDACDISLPDAVCSDKYFLRDRNNNTTVSVTPINYNDYAGVSITAGITTSIDQILLIGQSTEGGTAALIWAAANATLPQPSNLKAKRISNTQIDLTWTDNTAGVAAYQVERSLDGLTKWQEVGVTAVGAISFSDTTVVCGARYHYRVSAADTTAGTVSINSFYDDANIPACTLPPISLKSPANGANITTQTPIFTWEPVNGVKQYRLVVTAADGDKPVDQVFKAEAIAEICDTEVCSFDLSANGLALPDDDYTWKVKAKVISGLKTESGVRTLEVDAFGAPVLLSPADGATDIALSPVFTWQAGTPGSSYKVVIKLDDVDVFKHTVTDANCAEAVCTLDTAGLVTLQASQSYIWRVIAKNNGDKEKSAKWTFTTGASSALSGLQLPGN